MAEGNGKQELVRAGEVLILQGKEPEYIHFLHSGSMEILSTPQEYEGLDEQIMLSHSVRVGIINAKTLISGLSILFTEPYQKSIRALEDCQITKYPIKEGGFSQICRENISLAVNILSHLYKRFELSISDAGKYSTLYLNLSRINDNMSLIIKDAVGNVPGERLQGRADETHRQFVQNGGEFPSRYDAKFLIADNSSILKKKYDFPGLPLDSLIDMKQCFFMKKFLKLTPATLGGLIKEDGTIAVYIFEVLSENLLKVLERVEAISNEIDEELSILFGSEDSWASFLVDNDGYRMLETADRLSSDFLKNLLSLAAKLNSFYKEISGREIIQIYPGLKRLHELYISSKERSPQPSPAQALDEEPASRPKKAGNVVHQYKNSLAQIFEFALSDKEFQKNFLKYLNDFKKMKNPFDTEIEGRKIRRTLAKAYWDLYGQVFVRSKNAPHMPPAARMMLHFGFLDDDLVEEFQIEELHDLLHRSSEKTMYPIYLEEEFLNAIYENKVQPSINEMGLRYEEYLREIGKTKSVKGAEASSENDPVSKVLYEVNSRITHTVSVCSGSTATAFPILTSMVMRGSPTGLHISKKKLESIISTLRDIDFSVFYRETVAKLDYAREIIEEEIFPNFILIPSFGTKTMLWQELEGTNRRSRGRIVIPVLFMGDILRNMAHTFACFRYELNRSIKGGQWRDPVEGGLTGVYLDYVQFYKKNPRLSVETKEKIAEKFRNIRDDRNRFADDYILWVLFEKDGIPKLNGVVREIFYKNIRFKKEVRKNLEGMPAFSEIATRFKNVHTRELGNFQRKFKKYADESGVLPEQLQKYLDFLES